MKDRLDEVKYYVKAMELWNSLWGDTEILMKELRSKEITRQLIRSGGSISANIEEGYGRGYGKEYPQYLRVSRGSARETKGWYKRAKQLLSQETVQARIALLDEIIAMESAAIKTLTDRNSKSK